MLYNCNIYANFFWFFIGNAETMWNYPWKMMIFY